MKDDRRERRFAFIETRLLWAGGLTARELGEAFGIARPNAQATLDAYRQRHPENLSYDARRKRQVRTKDFMPHYIKADSYSFLDYQRGMALAGYFHAADDWADLPFQDADRLLRPHLNDEAMRIVFAALLQRRTIKMVYLAKQKVSQRELSPHHLIYADNRYHLRAFCHLKQTGLDFVLSRIQHAEFSESDWIPDTYDSEWHSFRNLSFEVNAELPPETHASLRNAYALQDGEPLTLTVRDALAKYVVRRMTRTDAALNISFWVRQG